MNESGEQTLRPDQIRNLTIVIVLEGLALGGCPINAIDLARTLRRRGHRIVIAAIDEQVQVPLLPYAQRAGFSVELLPANSGLFARALQIRELAGRHDADVVHVFAPFLGPPAAIAMSTSRRRIAVVTNWEMTNALWLAPHTPMIVGTRSLQTEAQSRRRGDVWLMEPMVDLERDYPNPELGQAFRDQFGVADEEKLLTLVGRVDRVMKLEGIIHAIRAVALLDQPALRLAIVGDGNAMDEVRWHAEDTNRRLNREAILLTGSLLDPRPAYAGADAVLAMGGSALRALAHGKPLIVLGSNGFARRFDAGSMEYFLDRGFFGEEACHDPVGQLARLLNDVTRAEEREIAGAYGLAIARDRFGLSAAAGTQESIYQASLLKAPHLPARVCDAVYLLTRQVAGRVKRLATGARSMRRSPALSS